MNNTITFAGQEVNRQYVWNLVQEELKFLGEQGTITNNYLTGLLSLLMENESSDTK